MVDTVAIGNSEAILNSDFIALAIVKDRHINWVNDALHLMFGYDAGELIGQSIRILFQNQETYAAFGQ